MKIEISVEAAEFLNDLAERHPFYSDDLSGVVDDLCREWLRRDGADGGPCDPWATTDNLVDHHNPDIPFRLEIGGEG